MSKRCAGCNKDLESGKVYFKKLFCGRYVCEICNYAVEDLCVHCGPGYKSCDKAKSDRFLQALMQRYNCYDYMELINLITERENEIRERLEKAAIYGTSLVEKECTFTLSEVV